jgi:predicted molibdopterin-dependent oxidoreductase YjgC
MRKETSLMKKVKTTCIYCGCGCQMDLLVKDGRVNGVSPIENDPISRGELCIRGMHAHEFIHHQDRLTRPMVRKNGALEEVSWDYALKFAADKLGDLAGKYGAGSLGVVGSAKCTNEDSYILGRFARAVLKTGNIDNCARF